jgi:hypothetical protein
LQNLASSGMFSPQLEQNMATIPRQPDGST